MNQPPLEAHLVWCADSVNNGCLSSVLLLILMPHPIPHAHPIPLHSSIIPLFLIHHLLLHSSTHLHLLHPSSSPSSSSIFISIFLIHLHPPSFIPSPSTSSSSHHPHPHLSSSTSSSSTSSFDPPTLVLDVGGPSKQMASSQSTKPTKSFQMDGDPSKQMASSQSTMPTKPFQMDLGDLLKANAPASINYANYVK